MKNIFLIPNMNLLVLYTLLQSTAALILPSMSTSGNIVTEFSQNLGESALRQVQWMGTIVAQKEQEYGFGEEKEEDDRKRPHKVDGTGGALYNAYKRALSTGARSPPEEKQVWEALANLEQDSKSFKLTLYRAPTFN